MRDQTPIVIDDFRGLYDRGSDEAIPINNASDCANNIYLNKEIDTRPGFAKDVDFSDINPGGSFLYRRFFLYQITGEDPRYLILYWDGTTGKVFDTGAAAPGTSILTVTGMSDFTVLNMFDRAYITPHDRVTGLEGQVVYVYDGTTTRPAAGSKPTTGLAAATSATAGNVSAGVHLIAYVFETDSGFITKPSVSISYTAPGSKSIDLSSVDTGPTGTAKRHIIATRLIIGYDGNPEHYEFFFVPGGTIANNTGTTITIDFIDSALVSTADYLLDNLEEIPAGVALCTYQGSMVVAGEAEDATIEGTAPYVARISRQGDPESISAIDGFIQFAPGDGGGIKAVNEFRGLLYAFKDHRTLSAHSNGDAPSTWPVVMIDSGIGTESPFGLAEVLDARSNNKDGILVSDQAGLYMFNGSYAEKALSYNISDRWTARYRRDNVEISIDPIVFRVYITASLYNPDPTAQDTDALFVMDIQDGMSLDKVKWDIWYFSITVTPEGQPPETIEVRPLSIQTDSLGLIGLFVYNGMTIPDDQFLYRLTPGQRNDEWAYSGGTSIGNIDSFFSTGSIVGDEEGAVCQWIGVRLRILGDGQTTLNYFPIDDSTAVPILPLINNSLTPGKIIQRFLNSVSENIAISVGVVPDIDSYYQIRRLIIYGKPVWQSRPNTDS